jgi:tripartite-type tricarboxylate transporter receptor subunit TctC
VPAADVTERLAQGGFLVATTTSQELAALIKSDIDRMGDVVKRANVKVD